MTGSTGRARLARPEVVLFDLDGTLIDSAPDLAGACNDLRAERGLEPLPYASLRPMVGSGARGMIGTGFGLGPGDDGYDELRVAFLSRYEARMTELTRVFGAVQPLLDRLAAMDIGWGIVTNKAERFAVPLVEALALKPSVLVCGDTTPHAKPHPAPLLEAARRMSAEPARCVYVGDDRRDVDAGRAAGMATVVAAWGYLGAGEPVARWQADAVIDAPMELVGCFEPAT